MFMCLCVCRYGRYLSIDVKGTPRWPHVHVSPSSKLQTDTIMFRAGAGAGAEVSHMNVYTHETALHTYLICIKRGTNNFGFEPAYCALIHVVALFKCDLALDLRLFDHGSGPRLRSEAKRATNICFG